MPRLLIVTTVPESFPFFLPYADHFRRAGWSVSALTGPSSQPPVRAARGAGPDGFPWRDRFDEAHVVEWSRDPRALHRVARAARRVRELVAAGRYDLVHVHTPVASFVTRFALRDRDPRGPRVLYTAHGFHFHPGGAPWRNGAFLALEKLAARWTDWLVVMNREDEAAARRWRFLPDARIRRMPGIGVDLARYAPERVDPAAVRALRDGLGIGDDPCLLMVAEFIARKRHADLLRAFAALRRDPALAHVHLLLAGAGPLVARAADLVRALGLDGRVHFLGMRPDVPVLMRAARALVLPSSQEGLPRCVLEAMSMGLPVVATRIRGTSELLEGGCGTLVEVGDVNALAAALRDLLLDPAEADAAAGRARARSARYDEREVIRLHEALYADALGVSPSPPRAAGPGRPGGAHRAPPVAVEDHAVRA